MTAFQVEDLRYLGRLVLNVNERLGVFPKLHSSLPNTRFRQSSIKCTSQINNTSDLSAFWSPMIKGVTAKFPAPASSSDAPIGEPVKRILVVEDHEDTREMLKMILEMEKFTVFEALDGEEAYGSAVTNCPDLILMDLTLPVLDGLAATQQIRKHDRIRNTPIVFLTGRAEPERRLAAFAAGCNDFLVKPLDIDEVLRVVDRWLHESSAH